MSIFLCLFLLSVLTAFYKHIICFCHQFVSRFSGNFLPSYLLTLVLPVSETLSYIDCMENKTHTHNRLTACGPAQPGSSLVFLLVLDSQLHTPYISSPNHHLLFAAHAHTSTACSAAIPMLCHLYLVSLSTPYLGE